MLGIPQQTAQSVEKSIGFCAETGITHISAYLLKIEEGTPFDRNGAAAAVPTPDEQAERYLQAVEALARHGFCQYEISNFAKPGFHSRHNCKYLAGRGISGSRPGGPQPDGRAALFLPVGSGRVSGGGKSAVADLRRRTWRRPEELALLGLRLCQGIDRKEAAAAYPDHDWDGLWQKSRPMIGAGYMKEENGRLFFTPEGFLLSNSILARIL